MNDFQIKPLTEKEFRLFQGLIYRQTGIFLNDSKKALLVGRLSSRLRFFKLKTFSAYFDLIEQNQQGELVQMLDAVCTNETHFFREGYQFRFLQDKVFP